MADNMTRLGDVLDAARAVADRHTVMDEHHAELAAAAHAELAAVSSQADSQGGESGG